MRVLACLVLCLAFAHSNADTPVRAPNCELPERPNEDVEKYVWDQFLAANQATLAWNEFVRTSLNAPKDYPPPRSDSGAGPASPGAASGGTSEPSPPSR